MVDIPRKWPVTLSYARCVVTEEHIGEEAELRCGFLQIRHISPGVRIR